MNFGIRGYAASARIVSPQRRDTIKALLKNLNYKDKAAVRDAYEEVIYMGWVDRFCDKHFNGGNKADKLRSVATLALYKDAEDKRQPTELIPGSPERAVTVLAEHLTPVCEALLRLSLEPDATDNEFSELFTWADRFYLTGHSYSSATRRDQPLAPSGGMLRASRLEWSQVAANAMMAAAAYERASEEYRQVGRHRLAAQADTAAAAAYQAAAEAFMEADEPKSGASAYWKAANASWTVAQAHTDARQHSLAAEAFKAAADAAKAAAGIHLQMDRVDRAAEADKAAAEACMMAAAAYTQEGQHYLAGQAYQAAAQSYVKARQPELGANACLEATRAYWTVEAYQAAADAGKAAAAAYRQAGQPKRAAELEMAATEASKTAIAAYKQAVQSHRMEVEMATMEASKTAAAA